MPSTSANDILIEYEEFGDTRDPAVLLIMGYGAQMTVWPDSFCRALAERSYRVIRFDNRDAGLSTHFDGIPAPSIARSLFASLLNIELKTPYTLDDMALDAIGLLDSLEIPEAHVVGASMGGMIAQIIGAKHAGRTRSLTSMMSTSGNRRLPGPRPKVLRHVLFRHKKDMDRDAMVAYLKKFWELVASPAYPTPDEERLRLIRSWVDRDYDTAANMRQFAAMASNGDRTELLASIERPALVIHGEQDPLIRNECGRHTAMCIKNARLEIIAGMGHDLPEALVPQVVDLIAGHLSRTDSEHHDFASTGVDAA